MLTRLPLISVLSAAVLTACATPQENPYYKYSSQYKGETTVVAETGTVFETAPVSYETVSVDAAEYQPVSTASYTRVNHECLKKEKNHELLGTAIVGTIGAIAGKELVGGTEGVALGAVIGGAAGYGLGDKAVNCDPQTVVMEQAAPIVSEAYVSPTDTEFTPLSNEGTPGYQVLSAQTVEIFDAPAVAQPSGIAAITGTDAQPVEYDYTANTISASADTFAIPSETRLMGDASYASHIVKQGDTVYSLSRQLCVGVGDIQSLNGLDASFGISIGQSLRLPASNC